MNPCRGLHRGADQTCCAWGGFRGALGMTPRSKAPCHAPRRGPNRGPLGRHDGTRRQSPNKSDNGPDRLTPCASRRGLTEKARRRHREPAAAAAGGVLRRHARRIGRKRIDDVGVVRLAVALHLPDRGHRDLVPAGIVIVVFVEVPGRLGRCRGVAELPVAACGTGTLSSGVSRRPCRT